jgi:hypothetical protein
VVAEGGFAEVVAEGGGHFDVGGGHGYHASATWKSLGQ